VTILVDGPLTAGTHRLEWDGRTLAGEPAAPGVYFARLTTSEGQLAVRKLIRSP
jgi:hypothetical protein